MNSQWFNKTSFNSDLIFKNKIFILEIMLQRCLTKQNSFLDKKCKYIELYVLYICVFEETPFVTLSLKYQREIFMKIFIHITKLLSGFNRRNSTKKHKCRDEIKVQV